MNWLEEDRRDLAAERILDAAAARFRAHGVAATGMAEVAAAAGCSRATLYRYFENRRALHVAFVHREARRIGVRVADEVAGITDPPDLITEAALTAVRLVRADPTLAAWFRAEDAAIATELAHSSAMIAAIGVAFLGDDQAARWLVRVIVSLLTVPGVDEDDERALLRRFVAPVVAPAAPYRSSRA